MRRRAFLIAIGLAAAVAAQAGDWKLNRRYRRKVQQVGRGPGAGDTAAFGLPTGGQLLSGGRDVLVADGRENVIPSKILSYDSSGTTWVAFQASKAKGAVWVYYGRGVAKAAPPGGWKPKLSLMLKTMPLPPGSLNGYRPIATAAARGRLYGMGFVDSIWHAVNPYGPDDSFASVYEGYLTIDTPGSYRIFTNSDDASFILLNGKDLRL